MSYTVLARRYRSGTFDEVVGQEHVARTLKKAIESERIAHAFLFCGTRGVGKTSMARILAKALNCDKSKGPTTEPCGECASCKAISTGQDLDVIEIDAASNNSVEDVREVIENSRFRPARARFKVYIIDEVHMLSRGAFNALLKTLEEPPSHVKFILATTETEKVPATILSRCQRYDFRNIPTREIAEHLKSVVKKEKVKAEEDALLLVAKAGAGSMRDALSLLDRLLSLGEKELTTEMIEQLLGMPKAQVIFDLAEHIGSGDVKSTLTAADKLVRDGLSPESLVAAMADHLRNILIIVTCGMESQLVEVAGLSPKQLTAQAAKFDAVTLSQSIAVLEDLRRSLRSTAAGRAMLDATLVRLALAEQFTRIEDLLAGGGSPGPGEKKKYEVAAADEPPIAGPGAESDARSAVREAFAAPDEGSSPPDEADALPAVGRVYDGPSRSLGSIFASSRSPAPRPGAAGSEPGEVRSNVETVDQGEFAPVMTRLREALRPHGPGFDGILVHGRIVSVGDGRAVIRYSHAHEASARMLERNGKRERVQEALSEVLQEPVGVTIEVDEAPDDNPAPASSAAANRGPQPRVAPRPVEPPAPPAAPPLTPEQKQQILASDDLVRAACELFNGEIVKSEP